MFLHSNIKLAYKLYYFKYLYSGIIQERVQSMKSNYDFHTMLERATLSFGTTRVTSKVALIAGSSQHGKARLASVAWKEETNYTILLAAPIN